MTKQQLNEIKKYHKQDLINSESFADLIKSLTIKALNNEDLSDRQEYVLQDFYEKTILKHLNPVVPKDYNFGSWEDRVFYLPSRELQAYGYIILSEIHIDWYTGLTPAVISKLATRNDIDSRDYVYVNNGSTSVNKCYSMADMDRVIKELITSATKVTKTLFESPMLDQRFKINDVERPKNNNFSIEDLDDLLGSDD